MLMSPLNCSLFSSCRVKSSWLVANILLKWPAFSKMSTFPFRTNFLLNSTWNHKQNLFPYYLLPSKDFYTPTCPYKNAIKIEEGYFSSPGDANNMTRNIFTFHVNCILQARKEPLRAFMIEWEHYITMAENFSVLTCPLCLDELSKSKTQWVSQHREV